MTNTELKNQIDTQITDQTADNSITPTFVGENLKSVIDLTKPYKEIRFKLSISGSTPTPTYEVNDFSGETITMTIPSNGKLRIEITNNVLISGQVEVDTSTASVGGVPYFLVPEYGLLPVFLDIDIKRYDNDQSSTPSLTNQRITIKVYD